MTIAELKIHSDERDDRVEIKLDKIDDYLRNGFSDKIIKTIQTYFDGVLAKIVKWLIRIIASSIIVAVIGIVVKLIFFN